MRKIVLFFSLLLSFTAFSQVEKPVHWRFSTEKLSDNEYYLVFTASIDEPWHIYANDIKGDGPIPTSFNYDKTTGIEFVGKVVQMEKPVVKFDEGFQVKVGMYAKKAVFKQKVKINSTQPVILKGYVESACCNDRTCLPPEETSFTFNLPAAKQVSTVTTTESPAADTLTKAEGKPSADTGKTVEKTSASNTSSSIAAKEEKKQSLWQFFLANLLAGFVGVLTPCVYPMIPMTVSFFMRNQQKRRKTIMNALFFGISIILIYSSLGLIVTLSGAGADFFNAISTHWISNTIFFLLFLVFAASFLGLFEITLPGSLSNKIDQQADKGGILAPFFMALTLVVVSFSCTGPIVSALLIEAIKGEVIRPTIGMFGYSLAFALPFTLFAVFPGLMSNLPKSGGWLNSVKVFFAFVLLAWGLKFLSNIDQGYHLNLFTREVYIGIWIVLFTLLGFYLLGKIKFSHDSDLPHVGVVRLFFVITVFSFVMYLIPGMFGAPLTAISGWLPPRTSQVFDLTASNTVSVSQNNTTTNCGPGKYSDFLKIPYGIQGYFDYEEGLACAKKQQKPVLLDFNGHYCTNCKLMENKVWPDTRVLDLLKNKFVIVSLYIDDRKELPQNEVYTSKFDGKVKNTLGKKNADFQATRFNINTQPYYVILDDNGNQIGTPMGLDLNPDVFQNFLENGLKEFDSKKGK